jgi:lysophospholipase L1-like esterase
MINHSAGIAASILQDASVDGVSNVLYLGFYYLDGLTKAADYADPLIAQICQNATVNCYFIDPRPNITSAMIGSDGLHPTEEGYKVLAELIWDVKLSDNIPV